MPAKSSRPARRIGPAGRLRSTKRSHVRPAGHRRSRSTRGARALARIAVAGVLDGDPRIMAITGLRRAVVLTRCCPKDAEPDVVNDERRRPGHRRAKRSTMCVRASWAVKKAPSRLTRMTRRHSSVSSRGSSAPAPPTPALTKHESTAELADRLGHRRHDRVPVADVAHDGVDVAADGGELLDGGVVLGRVGAPDRDRRAPGQALRPAEADAAVAAGDQRDVAGEIEAGNLRAADRARRSSTIRRPLPMRATRG